MNKALFLDRDGVINFERGAYTYRPEDFEILPHVVEVLKLARDKGYLLIVVSNQSGIDKGYYTVYDVEELHKILVDELAKSNIHFAEIYYSVYHPSVTQSLSRKPGSIMLEKALARFKLNKDLCLMIGDKERDIEAAKGAGVKGILIEANSDLRQIEKYLN